MNEQTERCRKCENLKLSWRQKTTGERWVTIQKQFLHTLFQKSMSDQERIFEVFSLSARTLISCCNLSAKAESLEKP